MRHSQPSPAKSTAEDPPPEEEAAKYKKKLESLLEAHHSLRASEQSARDRIGRLLDRQKQDQWAMGKYVDLLAENRSLKVRLEALESRVSEESAAAASLTSKCEELEAVIAFLDDEIAAARANTRRGEELEARVGELERTIEELRARALILEAETASSARKLMEEEEANGRLKRRCEESEARVLSLEAEKSSLQSKCEKLDAVVVLLEDDNAGSARKLMEEGVVEEKGVKIAPHIIEIDDHSISEKDFVKILSPNRSRVSKVVLSDSEEEDDEDNTPIAKLMKQGNGRNIDRRTEDFDDGYVRTPMPSSTRRRKFASRVVTSDSDDDDEDDNIPISKLKRPRTREAEEESPCPMENVTPMRRLVRRGRGNPYWDLAGRNLSHTKTSKRYPREQSTVRRRLGYSCLDSEDDEEKEDDVEIDSDGDNIDEFIVSGSGSESLEARSTTSDSFEAPSISDDTYDEELTSDVDVALRNVLDKYYRKMNVKRWEYETDMLASFPKDPQLCMTAVCALYRQQTDEEQKLKGTIVVNGRGFNQFDAVKGSMIAEFLLDGDTYGPVKKTVEELEMHFPEGLDYCLTLAYRYSKQLFAIYQLKEDPYFSS